MNQRENAPDWSEAEYNNTFLLSQAPDGANYNAIWAPNSAGVWAWIPMGDSPWQTFKEEYDDDRHDLRLTTDTGFSWLAEVDTNGDTAGDDIGNCTADDAYLNVRTNPIYVQY